MGIRDSLVISLVFLAACDPSVPNHSNFTVGMARDKILSEFGEPQGKQMLTKSTEHIWGPIEEFWPRVPYGASVEIWSYDSLWISNSKGNAYDHAGQTQLYFVNDSKQVNGIGFHTKGAVYEGS